MNSKFISFVKCALAALALPAAVQAAPDPNFHIYLLLGQSNMQGAAHLPDTPVTHPNVRVLQGENCSGVTARYGEWREHFHPVVRCPIGDLRFNKKTGRDGTIGLGPGDSFAVTMADAAGPNVTIGLVGAAFGGTDIQYHLKNCSQHGACAAPYGSISGAPGSGNNGGYVWALDLAKKAQEVGVIKGFIFHHGENNAGQSAWVGHVKAYVTDLRNDLGLDPLEVPFIAGELPRTGGSAGAHNPLVQQIDDQIVNGHWVSSGPMPDGTILDDRGDNLHWSTDSVIEMGKRYAAKMLEMGHYGPVDCGSQGATPVCCNIKADPDGDGIGEQNDGQQCVVTEDTAGWHPGNPQDVVLAINVGGSGDAIAFDDIYFDADSFYTGGTQNSTSDNVAGSGGSAVYQTERYGDFSYDIPLANGDYNVELGIVELYHEASGNRAFNVSIEGKSVISGLDPYQEVGHDNVYFTDPFAVTVADGQLDIDVTKITDNGTLSSILVRKVGGVASSAASSSSSSSAASQGTSSSAPSTGVGGASDWLLVLLGAGLLSLRGSFRRRAI